MGKKSTRSPRIDCDPMLTVSGLCSNDEQPADILPSLQEPLHDRYERHYDFNDMGSPPTIAAK